MKRVIFGWLIMFIGAIPFILLFLTAMQSWIAGRPINVHGSSLMAGGVVFIIGFTMKATCGGNRR